MRRDDGGVLGVKPLFGIREFGRYLELYKNLYSKQNNANRKVNINFGHFHFIHFNFKIIYTFAI